MRRKSQINSRRSRNNIADNPAVDVGQPKVPAGIAVGQSFVIKAHQVQDRRVKVMDVNRVFGRLKPKLIGRPVNRDNRRTPP